MTRLLLQNSEQSPIHVEGKILTPEAMVWIDKINMRPELEPYVIGTEESVVASGLYSAMAERRDLTLVEIEALLEAGQLVPGMYYRAADTGRRYYATDAAELSVSPAKQANAPSMIDPNWYEVPAGSPKTDYPEGWQALNGGVNENAIVTTDLPDGSQGLAWHCIPSGNSGADGGFNYGGNRQPVDSSKTYRICSWFRRNVNQQGSSYHGLYNFNEAGANIGVKNATSGTATTNFYMFYGDLPAADEWYMVVSYLHPADSPAKPNMGGIYKYGDINKQANTIQDGRFVPGTVEISVRDYLFYATAPNGSSQHISQPRIDLVDGTEPSLCELLNAKHTNLQYENDDLTGSWANYASGYQKLNASIADGVVTISGLVKSGSGEIIKLPESLRPSGRLVCTQLSGSSTATGRVDVLSDGRVLWVAGSAAWVAINASFPAKWKVLGENR